MTRYKMLPIPECFDIGDLPMEYILGPVDAWVRRIRMSSIVPTQDAVLRYVVERYCKSGKGRDREGSLPYGIRFAGSRKIYLIDGHHRWFAANRLGKREFRLLVEDFDITFEEACKRISIPNADETYAIERMITG